MKRIVITLIINILIPLLSIAQDSIFFKDPYLLQILKEASENNSDIRIAQLSIQQSEAVLKSAKLTYLPSFYFSPSAGISNVQPFTYSLPVSMSWEISFGGKHIAEKKVVQAQYEQSVEELRYSQILLNAAVANAYYTLIMLDRQKAITQESIENQRESLIAIESFMEIGQMNQLAVSQAEAELHATEASLSDLEKEICKVETSLSLLLNRNASTISRPDWENAQPIHFETDKPIELKTLASRPDVRSAEYALKAACGNVSIAEAAFYPSLTISAEAGWSNNLGTIVNPGSILLNLIGSLVQPIFNRGELKANKKIAIAQKEQAEILFEKALLVAGGEVRDALAECSAARAKEISRQQQVEAGQKAYEYCKELLTYSQSVTYIDVLYSQNTYLSAQLQQSADWLELQQAYISLYKALCP